MHGSRSSTVLLKTYENIINIFDIQTKLIRLTTDNPANNFKAFQNLILPYFEHYFDDENDGDETTSDNNNDINVIESIKQSFDNVVANRDFLRIPCFVHTLQLVVNNELKKASTIQSVLLKTSKIAKLSHTSIIFAEKLERIGQSTSKANKTRWRNQFNTVEKFLHIPSYDLNEILTSIKHMDLCLLAKGYQILNEFISLLTLFVEASTKIQSENTISFIYCTDCVKHLL